MIKRCALYTRKSTSDGLTQDFNSLAAQREACQAYVRSQKSEGWRALKAHYDDGGLSRATLDRPALKCLLTDIDAEKIDVVELGARLDANPDVRQSLSEIDFWTVEDLLSAYISQGSDLLPWTADAQINRDRSLRLQYLAGLALDENNSVPIFQAMSQYRSYPENLFVVPPYMEFLLCT